LSHQVEISADNPDLERLKVSWRRPEFTTVDGIGPLDSLYQAGDAVAAIGGFFGDKLLSIGSGIMIGPGLMLTATHVLDEFPRAGSGPVLLTLLPEGAARAWLPTATVTCSGKSEFMMHDRKVVSDLSVVSCSLNSDAHISHIVSFAPIELCLPLPGQRLWAVGFRQGKIEPGAAPVTPLVSSGLVTACYPHGRGDRMRSPCVEVAMEAQGGMSGGPVYNEDGFVVGIVSSSFDGGPTYVTLVWDALRLSIDSLPAEIWGSRPSSLCEGKRSGLVKIRGNFKCDPYRNITLSLSDKEMRVLFSTQQDA
jgi:hypothetical protein